MNLVMNKLINSVVQIVAFAAVPFVWWLITARKKVKFTEWIGLKKIDKAKENKTFAWVAGIMVAFIALGAVILNILSGVETATSDFAGLGFGAVPAIIVYALFNTALPEEILFRGFILKRISAKFGFGVANVIQAVVFGLVHGAMFFSITGTVKAILIIGFTSVIAWFMGYVNEKKANGSILPSWMVHSASNIFSAVCTAFEIF